MRRPLAIAAVLLLCTLTAGGCARRPRSCEAGTATVMLCARLDELEHEVERMRERQTANTLWTMEQADKIERRLDGLDRRLDYEVPIGVPACDEYIREVRYCDELPWEASRAALTEDIGYWRGRIALNPERAPEIVAKSCRHKIDLLPEACGGRGGA